jgi:competence ComEA-like helix-hairpin-helix protein
MRAADTLKDVDNNNFIQKAEAGQNKIRSFAFVISVCVCVLFSLGFVWSFDRAGQSCEIKLDEKINPNNAPAASLIRLPGIGPARASAIIDYREDFKRENGDVPAFRNYDDLCKVRGIGPATAKNISEWLKFE